MLCAIAKAYHTLLSTADTQTQLQVLKRLWLSLPEEEALALLDCWLQPTAKWKQTGILQLKKEFINTGIYSPALVEMCYVQSNDWCETIATLTAQPIFRDTKPDSESPVSFKELLEVVSSNRFNISRLAFIHESVATRFLNTWQNTFVLLRLITGTFQCPVSADILGRSLENIGYLSHIQTHYPALLPVILPDTLAGQASQSPGIERNMLQAVVHYVELRFGEPKILTLSVPSANRTALVPVARIEHRLSEESYNLVVAALKKHIIERRGPVRILEPKLLGWVSYDTLEHSSRHKAGFTLTNTQLERLEWHEQLNPLIHLEPLL
jgi:hypothetical protein